MFSAKAEVKSEPVYRVGSVDRFLLQRELFSPLSYGLSALKPFASVLGVTSARIGAALVPDVNVAASQDRKWC